jgi:hypothetical protein
LADVAELSSAIIFNGDVAETLSVSVPIVLVRKSKLLLSDVIEFI